MWELLMAASVMFPNIHARDLDGHEVQTDALRGAPVVYLLGFTYESRHDVEAWGAFFASQPHGPRTVQMPVYDGLAVLARRWIDGSMARNTPAAVHPDVLTTTDRAPLVGGLHLKDPNARATAVLVDRAGWVVALERGAPTPAARQRFLEALHDLAARPDGAGPRE